MDLAQGDVKMVSAVDELRNIFRAPTLKDITGFVYGTVKEIPRYGMQTLYFLYFLALRSDEQERRLNEWEMGKFDNLVADKITKSISERVETISEAVYQRVQTNLTGHGGEKAVIFDPTQSAVPPSKVQRTLNARTSKENEKAQEKEMQNLKEKHRKELMNSKAKAKQRITELERKLGDEGAKLAELEKKFEEQAQDLSKSNRDIQDLQLALKEQREENENLKRKNTSPQPQSVPKKRRVQIVQLVDRHDSSSTDTDTPEPTQLTQLQLPAQFTVNCPYSKRCLTLF